jgi:hypothetical protein
MPAEQLCPRASLDPFAHAASVEIELLLATPLTSH